MNKIALVVSSCTFVVACGIFGTPTPKSNQCFAWCIDVPVAGQTMAMCYGTQAEMLTALASLQSAGVKATVRK